MLHFIRASVTFICQYFFNSFFFLFLCTVRLYTVYCCCRFFGVFLCVCGGFIFVGELMCKGDIICMLAVSLTSPRKQNFACKALLVKSRSCSIVIKSVKKYVAVVCPLCIFWEGGRD